MREHSGETVYVSANEADAEEVVPPNELVVEEEDSAELQDHTHQDNQQAAASGVNPFASRTAGRHACSRRLRLNIWQMRNLPDMAQLIISVLFLVNSYSFLEFCQT